MKLSKRTNSLYSAEINKRKGAHYRREPVWDVHRRKTCF